MNNQDVIRSAGAIVFRLTAERHVEVLLVGGTASDPQYWGFPKGRQESAETIEATAFREVLEETGIHTEILALIAISQYQVRRPDGTHRNKTVRFFLARSTGGDFANRDGERRDVRWFPIEDAFQMLTYDNDRVALRQAEQLLNHMPLYRSLLEDG